MEKQRKFLLVLPLLVIPFLTMAFWALGGGKGDGQLVAYSKGLNTDLPQAQFDDRNKAGKMAIYQAQRDSAQDGISPAFLKSIGLEQKGNLQLDSGITTDDQAQLVQAKLAKLNQQISQPARDLVQTSDISTEPQQVKHLNKMMQQLNNEGSPADPEMKQLDRMLDKLQAIQNPAAAAPKTEKTEIIKPFRAIPAIVDGKQRVTEGAAVKLKLTDTVTIKGQLLGKGQELFGSCQIVNQRLLLTIKNIRLGSQIIPANLTVYSQDGMPGIPAPEAELSGVAANNADQALQSMQLLSMDQSIGAQAAAGGINAAKDLFSKKVKKIKVKLQDEYPVLLKINR